MERLNAALADRYAIERELGSGGMATVHLAEDVRHRRRVALKVLRPDLAATLGAERFLREIEITANLSHPHILPLHDSGVANGFLYYVMPYVQGGSLQERLERDTRLPMEEALQIAREVADALAYAHGQDVVHRDIKPANILFEAGHAVVADFGVARAVTAAGSAQLTATGISLGSPAYMSPEQATGTQESDGRTDIYALGCVLYEMLGGEPPFSGPTPQAVMTQHVVAQVPSLRAVCPTVPEGLARAVEKAMAKEPSDRYETADQLANALTQESVTAATVQARSRRRWHLAGRAVGVAAIVALVAVLARPVASLFERSPPAAVAPESRDWILLAEFDGSANPSLLGTAREIASNRLDQSRLVRVYPLQGVPSMLSRAFKPDTTRLTETVARELAERQAIRTVATGTLDRVGDTYSIRLGVVDAETGAGVVTESGVANGEAELIPTIDRLAESLTEDLAGRPEEVRANRPFVDAPTPSLVAYRKYLQAYALRYEVGDYSSSVRLLREALALDPEFAVAWQLQQRNFGSMAGYADSARAAGARWRGYRHRLPEAEQRVLAAGDPEARIEARERWVREQPCNVEAVSQLGMQTYSLRSPSAALAILERFDAACPFGLNPLMEHNRRTWLLVVGRREEALQFADRLAGAMNYELQVRLGAAIYGAEWDRVDSLSHECSLDPEFYGSGMIGWANVRAIRGEIQALRDSTAFWGGGFHGWSLLHLASGTPLPVELRMPVQTDRGWEYQVFTPGHPGFRQNVPNAVTGAVWAALLGDTVTSMELLEFIRADTAQAIVRSGVAPGIVELVLAAEAGEWERVVSLYRPIPHGSGQWMLWFELVTRWLVAEAHERLGQPRLAAENFEPIALLQPAAGALGFYQFGWGYSFAHFRLGKLYAQLGEPDRAAEHWRTFLDAFTNPDPEFEWMVEEARAGLERLARQT
jgi:serine/threonine-protein kinase